MEDTILGTIDNLCKEKWFTPLQILHYVGKDRHQLNNYENRHIILSVSTAAKDDM